MKVNLKDIKNMLNYEGVTDITRWSLEDIKKLVKDEEYLNNPYFSAGVYGINGAAFQGHKSLNFYVITARNSNLFYLI